MHVGSLNPVEVVVFAVCTRSNLSFKPSKSAHVSFNPKTPTTYSIKNSIIHSNSYHEDLGIVVIDDLQWYLHHKYILSYKMFGVIRRVFSRFNSIATKAYSTCLITAYLLLCHMVPIPCTGY